MSSGYLKEANANKEASVHHIEYLVETPREQRVARKLVKASTSSLVVFAMVSTLILAFGAPALAATTVTGIQGQNPSESAAGPGKILADSDPDSTYHFVARVGTTGSPPSPVTVTVSYDDADADAAPNAVVTMTQVAGTDTWEAFVDLSAVTPGTTGTVTFTATDGTNTSTDVLTSVNFSPGTFALEIDEPDQGNAITFFDFDGDGVPETPVTGTANSPSVDFYFSTSTATVEPVWVKCGEVTVTAGEFQGTCELPSGTPPTQVTMIAAVTDGNTAADAADSPRSGDAHRVTADEPRINAEPETDTNTVTQDHVITITATGGDGTPIAGVTVSAEYAGANDGGDGFTTTTPDDQCTTGAGGTCTVTLGDDGTGEDAATPQAGTTTITVWASTIDSESQGDPENDDSTDVIIKTWSPGPSVGLDCIPEYDTNTVGTDHPVECGVRDANGNLVSGVTVNVEYEGANDPDDAVHTTATAADDSCVTSGGTCTVTLGASTAGETPPQPQSTTEPGFTTISAYVGSSNPDSGEGIDVVDSDLSDRMRKFWASDVATSLDCEPETDTNTVTDTSGTGAPGPDHQVNCAARDQFGNVAENVTINVEYSGTNDPDGGFSTSTPDDQCNTGSNGAGAGTTCSVALGDQPDETTTVAPGTTTITAWFGASPDPTETPTAQDSDNTDVVLKFWQPGAGQTLDCVPEYDTNTVATDHQVQCGVRDSLGNPVSGVTVNVEYTGANDPDDFNHTTATAADDSCVTVGGTCTVTLGTSTAGETPPRAQTTTESGFTIIRAYVGDTNPEDEAIDAPDGDLRDTVRKLWMASTPTVLDCLPEAPDPPATNTVGTPHTISCGARDQFGNLVGGATVTVEYEGANDPDAANSPTSPDDQCVLGFDAEFRGVTCSVTLGDGDSLGPPEFTTSTGGVDPGTTTITAWIDIDGQTATVEADPEPPQPDDQDDTDVLLKIWEAGPVDLLDCEPETDTNTAGQGHVVTCTATDQFGNGVSDSVVDGENLAGPNDPDNSDGSEGGNNFPDYNDFCTTDTRGVCTGTVSGAEGEGGTAELCFWYDSDEDNVYDPLANGRAQHNGDRCVNAEDQDQNPEPPEGNFTDRILKTWTGGTPPPPPTSGFILDCEPEGETNTTGEDHLVTCTITREDGTTTTVGNLRVDVEVLIGPNDPNHPHADINDWCTSDSGGICSGIISGDEGEEGTAEICFWIDTDVDNQFLINGGEPDGGDCEEPQPTIDTDPTDVIEKTWGEGEPPPPPTPTEQIDLDCEPETATNSADEDHDVTCSATDIDTGDPLEGVEVDGEFLFGPNDPLAAGADFDPFCTTDVTGSCTGTVPTNGEEGIAGICFWADTDDDGQFAAGGQSPDGGDCDEGPETDDDTDENSTDVVLKEWSEGEPPPTEGIDLDCEPEDVTNTAGDDHDVTCSASDESGPVSGLNIDGENEGGPNDPGLAGADFDDFCTTDVDGNCTGTIQASPGEDGTAIFCFWADTDEDSTFSFAGSAADGGGCDDEPLDDTDEEADPTDRVQKTWEPEDGEEPPPPGEPGTEQYIPEGSTHPGFNTFVLIANPNDFDVTVDVTFLTDTGPEKPAALQDLPLGPFTRRTISVNTFLPAGKDVATKIIASDPVVAEGSMHSGGIRASSDMVASPVTASEWFSPEGATHSGFGTFILIANPTEDAASTVDLTFFSGGGEINGPTIVVPAGSRRTVSVGDACLCSADVSTFTEVLSGPDVVVGMAIHKRGSGGDLGIGGSLATRTTANTWVVPEGATHSGWTSFILIANPNSTASTVAVTLLRSAGPQAISDVVVPARSRTTISLNIACGLCSDDVGAILEVVGGGPVSVEGTIQKEDSSGFVIGDSVGSPGADLEGTLGTRWYNAEGATHSGFTTFLLLANPTSGSASIDVTFIRSDGVSIAGRTVVLPPFSRDTLDAWVECINADFVADALCRTDVWAFVGSDADGFVMELAIDAGGPGAGFSKGRSLSSKAIGFPAPNGE